MRPRRNVPPPPKRFDFVRQHPKRYGILIVCFLIIIVSAAAIWYEHASWQTYKMDSYKTAPTVANQFDQVMSQQSLNIEQVGQLSTKISDRAENMCKVPPTRKVRLSLSDDAQRVRDTCQQSKQKVTQLARNIESLDMRLRSEAQLNGILKDNQVNLNASNPRHFSDYKQQWSGTKQTINDVNCEDSLIRVKMTILKATENITIAYDNLEQADSAKDRQAYDAAIDKLQTGHQLLRSTQAESKVSYKALLQKVANSRDEL